MEWTTLWVTDIKESVIRKAHKTTKNGRKRYLSGKRAVKITHEKRGHAAIKWRAGKAVQSGKPPN